MAGSSRQMALLGGFVAWALAAVLALLHFTEDDFLHGAALVAAACVAPLGAWLVLAAAPWAPGEPPAWSRVLLKFWEAPFLAILGGFMLWVRMLPYPALVGQGRAYFIGTDPFYHFRETLGIVRSFPSVPRFDPWTFYPYGTGTGQFGSLFDWAAAGFVVLTKGRDASEQYVGAVLGAYPAVLGALLIVPFWFLAKRLLGAPGAIVATITIALLPGEFLIRSLAGYSDHHVAEDLGALVGVLGVFLAAMRAHEARAALTSVRAALSWRGPALWGVLGGVALALHFYAWPPALLFLAILTVWLTIVILLEDGKGGDAIGYAFGGAVAFGVAGLMMLPVVETTNIGEFNTYGILHPLACFGAAAWVLGVHFAARWTRARGFSPWVVPGIVVGGVVVVYSALVLALSELYSSVLWGLSWVTGFGIRRTMLTISEARQAQFFCSADTREFSCIANDFGVVAPISVLILGVLFVYALWKRRPADILLLLWTLVMFRATTTQIRFSYYAALNIALLVGWLAARVAEWTGLEAALAARRVDAEDEAPARAVKGRKTKRVAAEVATARWWQFAAVALVLVLVLPGNVFATDRSAPAWQRARIGSPDGDLLLWMSGLDWMRANTPDAGVDLGLVVPRPPPGELYEYPPETYGVLTWWDYGHWIQTVAHRPPVANPFQQAAPFAATWFTERNPQSAERMLDDWVQGKGPVRYVFIDDAIATGKFGAITVWANSQNSSRAQWADGQFIERRTFQGPEGDASLYAVGAEYRESMMGRLYDRDGSGLPNYRLVWEFPSYVAIGNAANDQGQLACLHEVMHSGCGLNVDLNFVASHPRERYFKAGDYRVYDAFIVSPLKLFERVEGARLQGVALPGAAVTAAVGLRVENGVNRGFADDSASFVHEVSAVAGPDGRFEIVFPYATTDFLGAENGGTNSIVKSVGPVSVSVAGAPSARVDVPERAVLEGGVVEVSFA